MATNKRKAEGIMLLSLYNDEEEDEDEGEDEDDGGNEEEEDKSFVPEKPQQELEIDGTNSEERVSHADVFMEINSDYNSFATVEVSVTSVEASVSTLPIASPEGNDDMMIHTPTVERPGSASHGIIVDYAHDEGALSPDAEEGEIMTTGRAVLSLGAQPNNGFTQGISPSTLPRQENKFSEEQSFQDKLEVAQQSPMTTVPTIDILDQEMPDKTLPAEGEPDADPLADFLPPPPTTKCSQELQNKFAKFLAYKNAGRSFNEELRKSKGYRNPDFLERAVKHQEIDQIGSCFKKEIFNPHGYDASDFYDALAQEYKREQERKEQAKKQSQRVDFVHGGVQTAPISALSDKAKHAIPITSEHRDPSGSGQQGPPTASEALPKSESGRSSKKSKWDKVETDNKNPTMISSTVAKSALAAATAHTALLTANAGGGYASFVLQKRKEAEERSRSTERKSERKG